MWIMVSGPYSSGNADENQRSENHVMMNAAAVEVFRKGHIPVIGVNMALPMIAVAGSDSFDEIMMPLSLSLIERCDAVLRIHGSSMGADDEVLKFQAAGKLVFYDLKEIRDVSATS